MLWTWSTKIMISISRIWDWHTIQTFKMFVLFIIFDSLICHWPKNISIAHSLHWMKSYLEFQTESKRRSRTTHESVCVMSTSPHFFKRKIFLSNHMINSHCLWLFKEPNGSSKLIYFFKCLCKGIERIKLLSSSLVWLKTTALMNRQDFIISTCAFPVWSLDFVSVYQGL